MKLLYDLNKEGVSNERIQKHLKFLKTDRQRNSFCREILDKKLSLIRLKNQCDQLKLVFDYDINHSLKNLDLINIETIQRKIESNIRDYRQKTKTLITKAPKFNNTKKRSSSKTETTLNPKGATQYKSVIKKKKKAKLKATKPKKNKPPKRLKKKQQRRKTPWARIIYTPMYG